MERVFDYAHPDPLELDKAKKMLKVLYILTPYREWFYVVIQRIITQVCDMMQEHEQALIAAIARLADTSDGEIGNNNKSKASSCLQSQNDIIIYYIQIFFVLWL